MLASLLLLVLAAKARCTGDNTVSNDGQLKLITAGHPDHLVDEAIPTFERSARSERISFQPSKSARQSLGRFVDSQDLEVDPELANNGLEEKFEGDITLFPDQWEELVQGKLTAKRRRKRKFIGPLARRWPLNKPIQFSFDGSHDEKEQNIIMLALQHWSNITCLDFERRVDNPTGNRIIFTDVDGCASNVGRHPLGDVQFVSLAPECMRLGVIAHEVAHALGFWHEQSRPDRDSYVTVEWSNIERNSKGQFLKEADEEVDSAEVPYDYGSIMHYRSKAFARYDTLFTIKTNIADYQRTIGQRDQLSFNDVRLMNKVYCSHVCPRQLPCKRGGYTDPRKCDQCKCPDGFTGSFCQKIMPGYKANCGGEIPVNEREWTTLTSPNYPNEFEEGQECSWLIVAPPGQTVELQFVGTFDLYCKTQHSLCMDYVEIRNSTDFANTGMRYCCYSAPTSTIYSATTDMLVLFRSFYQRGRGFSVRAKAVPSEGAWTNWSPWSQCSASCGGCGTQTRERDCPNNACIGERRETRRCNENPCQFCPLSRFERVPCAGFLSLLRGVQCNVERTVLAHCKVKCCGNYHYFNGRCVLDFPARDFSPIFHG